MKRIALTPLVAAFVALVVAPIGCGSNTSKKKSSSSSAAPATSGTSAGGGVTTPGDDHADTQVGATVLAVGQPTAGRIDRVGDLDVFEVTLTGGQAYALRTQDLALGMDTYLSLFDAAGTLLTFNDDDPSSVFPGASGIDVSVTTGGTFFLEVRHSNAQAGVGTYAIVVDTSTGVAPPGGPVSMNGEPVIQRLSDPPTGLPGGALTFAYIVADPQGDRVEAQFEYKRVSDTVWRTALPDLASPAFIGIVAAPTGTTYRFIWESGTDLPAFSGQVQFRVRAGDNTTGTYRYGPWSTTQPFVVTNP